MNSIKRARRRPRVRSCSFRSFWWLVTREGSFAVVQFAEGKRGRVFGRYAWSLLSTGLCVRIASGMLERGAARGVRS